MGIVSSSSSAFPDAVVLDVLLAGAVPLFGKVEPVSTEYGVEGRSLVDS